MSDRQRVYTKVLKTLKQLMPTQTQGHVVILAMMVTGIVIGKKAQLAPMSTQVPYPAKDKSVEKRMRRWVKNDRIEVEVYFLPLPGNCWPACLRPLSCWRWMGARLDGAVWS